MEIKALTQEHQAFNRLVTLCGSVADCSDRTVTILQDDATRTYHVIVSSGNTQRRFYGETILEAIQQSYGWAE